jgi:hypothetical protein
MASLAPSSSRLRGKSSLHGVASALELERRCGLRLRQVRAADLLLGVYDVMRVADSEFGLRVSRDVAGRWLELCGAAASSVRTLEISSAEELEFRFGSFLRARGFAGAACKTGNEALLVFGGLFPHVDVEPSVLVSWARRQLELDCRLPDLSHLNHRRRGLWRDRQHAPRVRSYEDLVSKCEPLLDCVFEAAPRIAPEGLCRAMVACHIDIDARHPPEYVRDYVALRRAGFGSGAPLVSVPPEQIAKCLVDHHLHGASISVMQRCALERGAAIGYAALRNFRWRSAVRVLSCWSDVRDDGQLYGCLQRLLAKHLVLHGVHRVCEELLALENVCLPFGVLHSRLLARRRLPRGPLKNLGRLPLERCWRVMFAYVERARASFGGRPSMTLVAWLGVRSGTSFSFFFCRGNGGGQLWNSRTLLGGRGGVDSLVSGVPKSPWGLWF